MLGEKELGRILKSGKNHPLGAEEAGRSRVCFKKNREMSPEKQSIPQRIFFKAFVLFNDLIFNMCNYILIFLMIKSPM